MKTLDHTCHNCQSEFAINYVDSVCESDPTFCPFCGEYLLLDSENLNTSMNNMDGKGVEDY